MSPSVTQLLSKENEKGFSCAKCGRSFEVPLQVTNHSVQPEESYPACPFCFTRSEPYDTDNETVDEPLKKPSHLPKMPDFSSIMKPEPESEPEIDSVIETESDQEAPEGCPQFFGYLKTRPRSESFPDTCLTCKKMLECLMK